MIDFETQLRVVCYASKHPGVYSRGPRMHSQPLPYSYLCLQSAAVTDMYYQQQQVPLCALWNWTICTRFCLQRKRLAKRSSAKLYCTLLSHNEVYLVCDICIHIDDSTQKCVLNNFTHKCCRNWLVLFTKNTTDDGNLLRMRPPGYNPAQTDRICEHLASTFSKPMYCINKLWLHYWRQLALFIWIKWICFRP